MATSPMSEMSRQLNDQANYGMDWFRQWAEQGLDQSKMVLEGFMMAARNSVDTIDQNVSDIRKRSLAMAGDSVANGFDFAQRVLRAREPQEVLQIQSEFIGRQAQALADQAKELGQAMAKGAEAAERTAVNQLQAATGAARRRSEGKESAA